MDSLTLFGLLTITAMLIFYALEDRSHWFVLLFAMSCALGSAYGFLQGAWPFGLVEAIWAGVALRKWLLDFAAPWGLKVAFYDNGSVDDLAARQRCGRGCCLGGIWDGGGDLSGTPDRRILHAAAFRLAQRPDRNASVDVLGGVRDYGHQSHHAANRCRSDASRTNDAGARAIVI